MVKTLSQLAASIPAALVGGGVFVLSVFVLQIGISLSLFVALCSYVIAGIWIFPVHQAQLVDNEQETAHPVFQEGFQKIGRVRKLACKVEEREVREKIEQVGEIAYKLFSSLKKHPQKAATAQQFVSDYLDPTLRIFNAYLDLSQSEAYSLQTLGTLDRFDRLFDKVQAIYEKHLSEIFREGELTIDTELAELEETFDREGGNVPRN
ncbi:MAG: 5-bromo-4-chloroindolyl phosphate hydrolysis family protein [Candidatus Vecturithrix sp.]|jgi:5-bromo-4-chloroindolyl phosphate hydrolysis protein|nr:5-bromo-4-chloroindolyl phosphate hydrolysis family protein [Candidatus Vecturithrix sp.]